MKMGTSQRRKQSVKGCALPRCSRQVEFKAASEQKLGRKKRETAEEWEQERGRPPQYGTRDSAEIKQGETKRQDETIRSSKGAQGVKSELCR